MKFFFAATLALAVLACSARAQAPAPEVVAFMDPSTIASKLESLGADKEFSAIDLTGVDAKSIIATDKFTLALLEAAGELNAEARAIFSWIATNSHIVWKLSLFDIEDFTGAHLHLNTPEGPIVQHLVPDQEEGDFIAPVDIPQSGRVSVGSFGIEELQETLGVTSIRDFIEQFIIRNEIYINVHGPDTIPILRGFLNA
jgi:hypothetical protein